MYASSVAAYGFHRDNPVGMTEDWPTRPAKRLFYAQEKAELEQLLNDEAAAHPGLGLYVLRPPVVLGPHAVGAKAVLPGPLNTVAARLAARVLPLRFPLPVLVPDVAVQFIHEDDVGQALLLCVVGAGPPGAYNIAGDGVMTGADIARELGLAAIPIPGGLVRAAARAISRCRSRHRPSGWRRRRSRPSWTPPKPNGSSGGSLATPAPRRCGTRSSASAVLGRFSQRR